jgi:hypothetical protein
VDDDTLAAFFNPEGALQIYAQGEPASKEAGE